MACRAFSGNNRLVLLGIPVCDAGPVVTLETKLRHVVGKQFFADLGAVRVMAKAAERSCSWKVDVLLGRYVLVMAFIADIGHRRGEQIDVVGGMGIVTAGALGIAQWFMLIALHEARPVVAVITEVRLLRFQGQYPLVRTPRVGCDVADAASFLHCRMGHPSFAHRLMTLIAVVFRGRVGGPRQEKEAGGEKKSGEKP